MDEIAELNRLSGRAVVAMVADAPRFEARLTPNTALVLSGEPVADLNMFFVGPGPDAPGAVEPALERVTERGLPLVALFTPHVAEALVPLAERFGLTAAGTMPLMVLRDAALIRLGKPCDLAQAVDATAMVTAGELAAAAFSLPGDSMARGCNAGNAGASGAETFIGSWDGVPMCATTVTRAGSTAGIWTMSTPPEHQGKGMGRALLTRVLDRYRRQGVERFYLFATAAGRPLYESIGFETISDHAVWVLGHSTQVAA
jgi:GNAT superfamily N-acetyltransferase